MIDLGSYRLGWERLAASVPSVGRVVPVTLDAGISRDVQSMTIGDVGLFWLAPESSDVSRSADSTAEVSECLVFVVEKYNAKEPAMSVLERTQPVIEAVKNWLRGEYSGGCSPAQLVAGSMVTMPETKLYAGLAGWSLGFKLSSD